MTRWKLTIEYDGTDFCGWQRQLSDPTIQGTIEEAIKGFSDETVTLHVAGRTDAGVHAVAQVAHFDLMKETTSAIVRDALNFYLRFHKIAILNAEQVDETFHARFKATGRNYRYRIINRRPPLTFQANYAWHIIKPLDVDVMREAAALLIGTHDFTTFRALDCQANSPIRTLNKLEITREGEEVSLSGQARSFLYHQMRNMIGTLSLVGTGHWSLEEFKNAFNAKDRTKGGPTAPAYGLYFVGVTYPEK